MSEYQSFSVGTIEKYLYDENSEFATMRLEFISDGYNTHHIPFTLDLLKQYAPTILGKPIVAKYDSLSQDVTTHRDDEIMVGYIPSNAEITFKESENGTFACVDGLISKIYASDVYEIYKDINHRNVSIEVNLEWETPQKLKSFNIYGVTLLGLSYNPSCTLASSTITQFSLESVDEYYQRSNSALSQFIIDRRQLNTMGDKTYKVNTTEVKDSAWGNVDKTKLRNAVMEAQNRATLVKQVYGLVLSGWEEAPSEKLKYPLMELEGDTFYYNRGALSSALGYAKAQNETEVVNKVEQIYKKLNLNQNTTNKEKQDMAIEGREAWGDVIKKVQSHEGSGAYVDSVEKNHIIYTKDNVRYRVGADVEVGKDDKTVHATIKWDTVKKDVDQKMEGSVDFEEFETLKTKCAEQSHIIMEYEKELEELRQFKTDTQNQQKQLIVDKVLKNVKDDLSTEDYQSLKTEGEQCDFAELSAWENRAKAMAYESNKSSHQQFSVAWRMAGVDNEVVSTHTNKLWK